MAENMGSVTVYIHKSTLDMIDLVATIIDTSRSEVIEKLCAYVLENDLEGEIWEDYEDLESAFIEFAEEFEEEEETEEESEEDEEEEED